MKILRKTLLACLLAALAVSLGYALAAVPNVELMTTTVFIAGFLLGARAGALVGASSMAIYSFFNPMGAALPPLWLAQVLAFALVGASGAWSAPLILKIKRKAAAAVIAGLIGFFLTFLYDTATSIAAYFVITPGEVTSKLVGFVVGGIAFMLMHQVWNAGVFLVVLPPALKILSSYRSEIRSD